MGDNTTAALIFQFHKGTIRTPLRSFTTLPSQKFQFHKGTIRTSLDILLHQIDEISIP